MFPTDPTGSLREAAAELIRQSAKLSAAVHPITRRSIIELVRAMNSYYSNLIEGHRTHPFDIERALNQDFSEDRTKRALQQESKAHIDVQLLVEQRLEAQLDLRVCTPALLCWIHKEFYERLPEEFRILNNPNGTVDRVEPGSFRSCHVEVGRHVAPSFDVLNKFLSRFAEAYDGAHLDPLSRIIAVAASHHRLAWIHPFSDGNGRVTRLFTHAFFLKTKADGQGLWTISRGLARHRDDYMTALAEADNPRYNDLDGRGSLSEKALHSFCEFFFRVCFDQIAYMRKLLSLDSMQERIQNFGRLIVNKDLPPGTEHLLSDIFVRGEISRGEVGRILSKSERTTSRIISQLLKEGLLVSDSHRAPVRLGFPMKTVGYYFPDLFPQGFELQEAGK